MSITVVCPNGHTLKAKDSMAGRSGLCPMCKARITIPNVPPPDVSEDAILDFIGKPAPSRPARSEGLNASVASEPTRPNAPPKKTCSNCDREISAGHHICPHCRTYIAGLSDFGG